MPVIGLGVELMQRLMLDARRAFLVAIIAATSILASIAAPVSAAMPDGAYARFGISIDGDIALIFLSYTGSTTG
jgi:hypothetical protein